MGETRVGAAAEAMNHALGPGSAARWRQLECGSFTVDATVLRGSIKVARGVEGQASIRIRPLRAIAEVVEDFFRPSAVWRLPKLIHDSAGVDVAGSSAAIDCGPVKIAGGVENHASLGSVSIGAIIFEAVQVFLSPASVRLPSQFEYPAKVLTAAQGCCAVEIAGLVEDHS